MEQWDWSTDKHTQASMQRDQEETRLQGHEKETWMEKGILSHVATFRSQSWQACPGSSCSWSSPQEVSQMVTGLDLISDPS